MFDPSLEELEAERTEVFCSYRNSCGTVTTRVGGDQNLLKGRSDRRNQSNNGSCFDPCGSFGGERKVRNVKVLEEAAEGGLPLDRIENEVLYAKPKRKPWCGRIGRGRRTTTIVNKPGEKGILISVNVNDVEAIFDLFEECSVQLRVA